MSCVLRYTTQPAVLLLNTARIQPGSQPEATPCTWQPWLARAAPGPPQESLVRDETRRSLPTNPSLPRPTLGQLCVAPRTSRSRPVTTDPGTLMAQLALQYSAHNHCATREVLSDVLNCHVSRYLSPCLPGRQKAIPLPVVSRSQQRRRSSVFIHITSITRYL